MLINSFLLYLAGVIADHLPNAVLKNPGLGIAAGFIERCAFVKPFTANRPGCKKVD